MCNKAVGTYPSALQLVPECHKPQEMSDKAVDVWRLYLILFFIDIKLKKCVMKLFPKKRLCKNIVLIDTKTKNV